VLREAARRLPAETAYQKTAAEMLIDDFYAVQAELATRVLTAANGAAADPLAAWVAENAGRIAPAEAVAAELRTAAAPDLAMLVVASRQLRQALA
jgi:glutamate dehydrogenase